MLSNDQKLKLYEHLVRTRTFEDWIFYICHNQDHKNPMIVGKGYLSTGQEAVSCGSAFAMEKDDWLAPSHRDVGAHLIRGVTMKEILLQYMGRQGSPTKGRDGNVHFGSVKQNTLAFISHMGGMLAPACGVAFGMKYRNKKNAVVGIFGDGAAQQGVVHESMNYAATQDLPVVFVLNNNRWAISTPIKLQTKVEDLHLRGAGYGIPARVCEGNNVFAVYDEVQKALADAKAGKGPTLIECKSMRMSGHGTYDMAKYVPKEEFEYWKNKDPIEWAERILVEESVAKESDFADIKDQIKKDMHAQIEEAVLQPQVEAGPQELEDVFAR